MYVLYTRSCPALLQSTVQDKKLKSISYCHAGCRTQLGFTSDPDDALDGEGSQFRTWLAVPYLPLQAPPSRLAPQLPLDLTLIRLKRTGQLFCMFLILGLSDISSGLDSSWTSLGAVSQKWCFFPLALGLLLDGTQLLFVPFLRITYFGLLIKLVSTRFLHCKATVFSLELVSFIERKLEALNTLFFHFT